MAGRSLHSRTRALEDAVFFVPEATPIYVWRDMGEAAEAVESRFLEAHPEVPVERVIVIGWQEPKQGKGRKDDGI